MRLLTKTSELTPQDFIKKTLGNLMYVYYMYLGEFHTRPKDLVDLVDGLLYIDARSFLEKQTYEAAMNEARSRK